MTRSLLSICASACALIAGVSEPEIALAQAVLTVEPPPAIVLRPFRSLPAGENMEIIIENPSETAFNGILAIEPSDATAFAWPCATGLPVTLTGDIVLEREDYAKLTVSVEPESERRIVLRWRPDAKAYAEPGRCAFRINVHLVDEAGLRIAERNEVPVPLEVLSDSVLSIAGTSGTLMADRTFALIDFGELETGERAHIVFGAQANTDVEFLIGSENGGKLIGLDNPEQAIDYSASFDGEPLALESGQIVARRPDPTLAGSRYRLDLQIGNVSGAFAGTYQDILTVELRAQ